VVANVVDERLHHGEVVHGTKHFSPGTKVHVVRVRWGMGGETVTVLGLARRPKRWIVVDVRSRVLERWRAKVVYEPAVLRRLDEAGARKIDEDEARRIADRLAVVAESERIRLVEGGAAAFEVAAAEHERRGGVVLRAALPEPKVAWEAVAYVLNDGPEPVAAGLVGRIGGSGAPSWRAVWVGRDRVDALAELVIAVQRRAPEAGLWWMTDLTEQLRAERARRR
jgi:hypothetical protein